LIKTIHLIGFGARLKRMTDLTARIDSLTAKLTLEEKVALLTGHDFWNTVALESIGLRNMLLSDGPAGVRGEFWDERDNSLNLPSGTALGSSWSPALAAEYGRTLGSEAARKGVDVVLGPTINLHRSPFGGRHFECLSEDAMLTGALATSFTQGIQSTGIGACPKHYVANDFETERFTANVTVDERTLREVYLRPFEDAVVDGKAWTIMSAYNSVNGKTMTENELLQTPLRSEWGFDGVVISDWTAVRSLESAKSEQDLVMPGPIGPWGDALVAAVRSGEITESTVDRKVKRMILLAIRVGAIGADGSTPAAKPRHNNISDQDVAFARKASVQTSVLLRNEDEALPIDFSKYAKVALIGNNAELARTQGGGSATVMPKTVVTPLQALKKLLGDKLSYSIGAVVQHGLAELPKGELTNPLTGEQGAHLELLDETGNAFFTESRGGSALMWLGSGSPIEKASGLRFTTDFTPTETRTELLGIANVRHNKITVDGETIIDEQIARRNDGDPFADLMDPPFVTAPVELVAGKTVRIVADVDLKNRVGLEAAAFSLVIGTDVNRALGDKMIADAVENAKNSDLAIVVVGTNSAVESEGIDRQSLKLPGRQDELVEAVLAVNKNVVVIVNSGSPVLLPWRNEVKAILLTYFAGQEMGNALVDMLTGAEEPGGRLPTTWAIDEASLPVSNCTPVDGQVVYEEGIHIGYRAWLKSGAKTAFNFGFGLGYTSWEFGAVSGPAAVGAGADVELTIPVTNTGARKGKQVVQVYASRSGSSIDRPVRWLVGFAEVNAGAHETVLAKVNIRGREFAHWASGWEYEAGTFELHIGTSVTNTITNHWVTVG
jgi:beta-glucosidase